MTIRFRQIDDSNRGDHYHLTPADACLYLLEFTSGQGYSYSKANSLISNLKKKPTASAAELGYKREAIGKCAGALGKALNHDWIRQSVIVPIPPSKMVGDPAYDDRMFDMAAAIQPAADVRRLIRQTRSMPPSHEAGSVRNTVEDLLGAYEIDESLAVAPFGQIGILDDVLTAGTHFRAAHTILSRRFPGVAITGIFIARRVFANPFAAAQG